MTKISALTALAGGSVDTANDLLAIVDTSATQTKKITVADLIGLVTDITGLLDFKGSTDCSANPDYPAASKGDYYLVSVAGKIGGASGIDVTAGDTYFAIADNAGGTQAGVGTSWTVIQGNVAYVPVNQAGDTMTGDLIVPDEAYDATNWDGSLEVPTKNAVRDKIESVIAGSGSVSDAAYGVSWDGDTTNAPSKNAVYDKIETITAGTGAVPGLPRGRLTLVTGTPVLNSDQTAKTAIYYTPYNGERIPIYDGAAWDDKVFAELTLSLDTTNHVSGSLYDIFVWNDSGTIKIGTGPAWSSGTARGTGAGTTELELKNGIWTNKVSITLKNGAGAGTAGVSANTATYVGTFYATANGQTGMAFKPAAAANGTNNILGLYNAYNRVRIIAMCRDSTASWTYNSTTYRSANNSASNRISFLDGLQQSAVVGRRIITANAGTSSGVIVGVNLDSTTNAPEVIGQSNATQATDLAVINEFLPQLGFHYVQAMEAAATATAGTFFGAQTTPTRQMNSLSIELEM